MQIPKLKRQTDTVGSGGGDYSGVNICVKHHSECHTIGRDSFQEKYHLSFDKEIIKLLVGYIEKLKG